MTYTSAANISNDVLPTEIFRHGAYLCLKVDVETGTALRHPRVAELVTELGFENEYDVDGHPVNAVAFLRRVRLTEHEVPDHALSRADAIIHVASEDAKLVDGFCREMQLLLPAGSSPRVLRGGVRSTSYTGTAMHNFAYAHQVTQKPASVMPNAFIVPINKTKAWWEKNWLERHTYLLPRYDEKGGMIHEGHVLAAAAGIPCLMRRTYKSYAVPAKEGEYDFLTYFECADKDVPVFHAVCAALRDVHRNPEWQFVKEGPTWHGRRVKSWEDLLKR
jgi:hypothetical protein